MASTIYSYNLTGGRVFPVAFEYLARRFVKVTLVGTSRQEMQLNVDYRFISKTEIETTIAWTPGEFQTLEIRRVTSSTDRLVNFTDGSILRSQDLNISQIQAIHIAEEGRDVAENSMISGGFFWDALGLPIKNVGNPSLPTDAANGQYVLDNIRTALRVTPSETISEIPSDRANKVLAFDSNRQPVALIPSAGSSMELELALKDPAKGSNMVAWKDPVAPTFLKVVSDMRTGDPVSILRVLPKERHAALQNGTSDYDCAPAINGLVDLYHANTIKGGHLTLPHGNFPALTDVNLRGGCMIQGAGKDISTITIADGATVRLTGLGNNLERMCFHKEDPRENYITAGHKTDATQVATLSEVSFCKFTAGAQTAFMNYALVANYRSRGITLRHNRMYTYHLAFITKYLTSDWARLEGNTAIALNSAFANNSELFKMEALNYGWVTDNVLIAESVPSALSCVTLESGVANIHVSRNIMRSTSGYNVRVEHTDKTIYAPTDCLIEGNTLIAKGGALSVYSGSSEVIGLRLEGGVSTGPVTLYGTGTKVRNTVVRADKLDPRTGVTLRGDDITVRDLEIIGFGVGLANVGIQAKPDKNLDIRGLKCSGQSKEAVNIKDVSGRSYLGIDSIDSVSSTGKGAVYLYGSGNPMPADTLTVDPGSIQATGMPGIDVAFMNGVTIGDCSKIRSQTPYRLTTTDAFVTFEATFIAANFTSKAHRVNTIAKYAGKVAYNKDPKKPYFATGSAPTDPWVDAMGTVTYTPI